MNFTVSFRFRIGATRDKPDKDPPEPKLHAKDGGQFEPTYGPSKIGFHSDDDKRVG